MSDPNAPVTMGYPKNCGHQPCRCKAAPHSSYCSEACSREHEQEGGCSCGHAECRRS